ncbi:Hypothetical protein FKW44_006829 [Caligus rogercresseyi]|uniref:Uncharacterized protein n=1 Tax=Caligus rogercresseyi TaxID=217165 RepID=A0A7T8QT38_CALRO|nr:Hypothetical protein FKW44_006829 [Caligus rogercresseyi]
MVRDVGRGRGCLESLSEEGLKLLVLSAAADLGPVHKSKQTLEWLKSIAFAFVYLPFRSPSSPD